MATSDNTAPVATNTAPAVVPVYFESGDHAPDIQSVVFGLAGVCDALDQEQVGGGMSYEQACRVANLACAARILSKQLHDRMTHKPFRARKGHSLSSVPTGAA